MQPLSHPPTCVHLFGGALKLLRPFAVSGQRAPAGLGECVPAAAAVASTAPKEMRCKGRRDSGLHHLFDQKSAPASRLGVACRAAGARVCRLYLGTSWP